MLMIMAIMLMGLSPVVARSGPELQALEHLTHLKDNPFKKKLDALPGKKRPSEKKLYQRKKIVKKDKWRSTDIFSKEHLKPASRWKNDIFKNICWGTIGRPVACLFCWPFMVIGEGSFWLDSVESEPCEEIAFQTPISPFIHSLFDDWNPLDAILVPPAWILGFTRIKTRKEVIEKKVKSDNYERIISKIKTYDKKLARKNKKIESYNDKIDKKIDAWNQKIDRHNNRMAKKYEKISKKGDKNLIKAVRRFNQKVAHSNAKIEAGIFPDPLPTLCP